MINSQQSIRIATRASQLALWQAQDVKQRLEQLHPGIEVALVPMTTRGDQLLDSPLSRIGGKGLFVKELEHALAAGQADIAVHSMKDVPAYFPEGLHLPVVMQRGDPRDAFVANDYSDVMDLPEAARVGTASLRRQCQLLHLRPDLQIGLLRGNVQTRLQRLDDGEFEAIILACAGLQRLGLEARITRTMTIEDCLPAIGQGAMGIECRRDDAPTLALIQPLNDTATSQCLQAERAVNARMGGNCTLPLAGYAVLANSQISLTARMGDPSGQPMLHSQVQGPVAEAAALGRAAADALLAQGADDILRALGLPVPGA